MASFTKGRGQNGSLVRAEVNEEFVSTQTWILKYCVDKEKEAMDLEESNGVHGRGRREEHYIILLKNEQSKK